MTTKQSLKKLISEGETKQVIEKLLSLTKLDEGLHNEVIAQSSRYNAYLKQKNLNLEDENALRIEHSKITQSLIYIIDRLPEADEGALIPQPPRSFLLKIALLLGVIAAIGISIFIITSNKTKTFTTTVFVHGRGGKDDKILKNQGEVCLFLNSNPERKAIDETGRAIFTEISPTFLNSKVRVTIEHPQPYQTLKVDSLYVLTDNGVIYLEAQLFHADKIYGTVTDFKTSKYLEGVRVSILNVDTVTNKNGWYELTIPYAKQAKFQRIVFDKAGYARGILDSIPIHTQQACDVALKLEKL